MECLLWYLEGSKRGNYRVYSLQETNKKLVDTVSELKKTSSTDSSPPSAPPMYPLLSELPGPDAFSLPTFLPLPGLLSSAKEDQNKNKQTKKKPKNRKDHNSLKEKPTTGRSESSLMLTYTSRTQVEFRALAKEFSHPSEDPLGFAKEFG